MFYWLGWHLEWVRAECVVHGAHPDTLFMPQLMHVSIDEETRNKALSTLQHADDQCETVEMPISAEAVRDLRKNIADANKQFTYEDLSRAFQDLQNLVSREMKHKRFLYIPPAQALLFPTKDDPHVFGNAVHDKFPSAAFDISEASVCLALSRPTASVYHLMRVLEAGLSVLGAVFEVSLAHTNWAPAIEQIESKIRDMHKEPKWKALSDCKEQQEFYAQAASHFGVLKDAWRNYTAHKRGKYTEEEADLIFRNVKAFMQKLATRLSE